MSPQISMLFVYLFFGSITKLMLYAATLLSKLCHKSTNFYLFCMYCFYVCYIEGMTEDGSFIGQYGRKRAQQRLQQMQQEEAAAAAAAAAAANAVPYGGGFATVV